MLLLAVSPATCFLAITQSALALNSASTRCASIGQTVCIACLQIHEVDDFGLRVYNTVKRHRILPVDISDNSGSLLITVGRDAQQPPYRIENRSVMHSFTLPSWHTAWRQLQPRLVALCMCSTATDALHVKCRRPGAVFHAHIWSPYSTTSFTPYSFAAEYKFTLQQCIWLLYLYPSTMIK